MNKLSILALMAAATLVAGPTYAADAAAGKAKAEEACGDCHGEDGKGDEDNPSIAGWTADKFTKAMVEYQDGTRTKDAKMTKAAKKMSAADVANLAAYYGSLPK